MIIISSCSKGTNNMIIKQKLTNDPTPLSGFSKSNFMACTNSSNLFSNMFPDKEKKPQPNNILQTLSNSNKSANEIYTNPPVYINIDIDIDPEPIIIKKPSPPQEIIKPAVIEKKLETIHKFSIKDNLIKSSENYWAFLRPAIKNILGNPAYKKQTEKIMLEISPLINQISQDEDVPITVTKITKLLQEIKNAKNEDLYLFAMNYICSRLIDKSDKYRKESKKNFLNFASILTKLSSSNTLLADFFFSIITYKCPYIIPKTYHIADFPDKHTYFKRLGYSKDGEPVSDWINNMECYSYFYFAFLSQNENYLEIIKDYLNSLQVISIDYPIATSFKVFLNALGAIVKLKIPQGMDMLKKAG